MVSGTTNHYIASSELQANLYGVIPTSGKMVIATLCGRGIAHLIIELLGPCGSRYCELSESAIKARHTDKGQKPL